jgi:hypothetical protein
MQPLIELICRRDHSAAERQDFFPVLTLHERRWGWCVHSGGSDHEWTAVEPGSLDDLRLRETTLPREHREGPSAEDRPRQEERKG